MLQLQDGFNAWLTTAHSQFRLDVGPDPNHRAGVHRLMIRDQFGRAPDGRLLTDIAREHLGAGATDDEVRKHVTEIVRLNWIQALDVNTPLILGQPLRLPGHTGDGGFITMDRAGNKRTVWDDGTVRIENTDGTGSTRKWQGEGKAYKENHRGPDPEDNYELRRTEDGKYEVAEADTENFRAQTNEEADLRVERARLKDLADERINDVEHRAAFEADMDRFEKRSKTLEEMYVKEGMSREDAQKMARQDVAKELKEKLEGARKDGKFPLLIHVHTRKEPFWSDSNAGKAGGSGGHHMISITDYDPVTGKVSVDNQWGKSADHFGNDGVPVADLYKATTSVYEDLMLEIEANRKSGGADAEKELELVEIARLEGRITAKDYEEAVVSVVLQSETRWQDKVDSERSGLEAQERQAEVGKVLEFINSMPTDERQEFLKRLDQELEKQKKARAQK